MKVKYFKFLSLLLAASMFSSSAVFAAIPSGTVVLGNKAYDLKYANNASNQDEISEAAASSGGKVYIKSFDGSWIDNTSDKTVSPDNIPEVAYKDESGSMKKYSSRDGNIEENQQSSKGSSLNSTAEDFVSSLLKEDYTTCTSEFSDTVKGLLTEDKLRDTMSQLKSQYGNYKKELSCNAVQHNGNTTVTVSSEFENGNLDFFITFDNSKQISNFYILPEQSSTGSSKYELPSYADTDSYTEKDVTVGTGEWALPGTLSIPKGEGPFPAVVLVHGSGANDRDETIGPNKPFKDIASGLASNGIAVLRYEKRTKYYGNKMAASAASNSITVKEETIDDAVSAVKLLASTDGIDSSKIYVLGHSLGGMLLPRIYSQDSKDICGLISMAGGPATASLEDTMYRQCTYLVKLAGNGTITPEMQSQLDKIKQQIDNIRNLTPASTTSASDLFNCPASYWLDLKNYNPSESAKSIDKPMLFLQGERDYQVTLDDLNAWKTALQSKTNVQFKTYPKLNHLFMEGEGAPNPTEYNNAGNIPEYVIDDIVSFIQ